MNEYKIRAWKWTYVRLEWKMTIIVWHHWRENEKGEGTCNVEEVHGKNCRERKWLEILKQNKTCSHAETEEAVEMYFSVMDNAAEEDGKTPPN
jgi:hypothetical protein